MKFKVKIIATAIMLIALVTAGVLLYVEKNLSPDEGDAATEIPSAANTVNLKVNPAKEVNPFNEEMLGVAFTNWDHSWGRTFPGEVKDLAKVIKAADIKLIRYAGGLWSNWVGWERIPQRTPYGNYFPNKTNFDPAYANNIKTSIEYNFHYGIDEIDSLGKLSKDSGANIMMQANIHKDDPYMWADMIKYSKDKGYNFKYWELGNEFDLDNPPIVSSSQYNTRLAGYIDVMKGADPNIKIIGAVPASAHDAFRHGDWSQQGLSQYLLGAAQTKSPTNKKIDSLSYHWYQDCNIQNVGINERVEKMMKYSWGINPNLINNSYSRIWSEIIPKRVDNEIINPSIPGISQGITELNMDACDFGVAPQNANQLNAVWMSDVIGRLAYNGLDYVTWYTGYGEQNQGYPAIMSTSGYNPDTVYLRPSYYTLFLYGNFFGDRMIETTTSNPQDISIWASTDTKDPDKVKIIVNNLSNSAYSSGITVQDITSGNAKKYVLTSTADLSHMFSASGIGNSGADHLSRINGYKLTSANVDKAVNEIPVVSVNVSGGVLTDNFPPYSVTVYVLSTSGNPIPTSTPTVAPTSGVTAMITPTLTLTPTPSPTVPPSPTSTITTQPTVVPTSVPTSTVHPTIAPTIAGVACGAADSNGDGEFTIGDFIEFAKMYQKNCNDKNAEYGVCGHRDANKNGRVEIGDFISFAKRYTPRESCALI